VKELVLDGMNGCRVTLFDPQPADGDEIWSYRVSLQMSVGAHVIEQGCWSGN
jgi:hypothetical protein